MKTINNFILEKLKISKKVFSDITIDTFKNGIDIFSITHLNIATKSGRGYISVNYLAVEDKSNNIIGYLEEFEEAGIIYTLILNDSVYKDFCSEFDVEEDDEYGTIAPQELYDILFYEIPDFASENNIYLMSVSTWLEERQNLLTKNDNDYIKFRDTYQEIKQKLS